jgi:dTDP-glucose 4,6-dehydratase
MRRLLISGGAGFIGANFTRHWLREHAGDHVVVLDALTYAGNYGNLETLEHNPQWRFVQGNICDSALVESLLRDGSLDTIVHFAAESHVDRSIAGPDAFIETNVVGTHSLLKAARKVWLTERRVVKHRFHHVSTDEVYGSLGRDDPPFSETTPYAPNSPYAASKAASDHLVRAYHHTYGLDTSISNCSNNYGAMHFPEKLIPLVIVNILQGLPVPVYGDGKNVRDWLHVDDHCRAIDLVLERGAAGAVYNIGGRAERENISIVTLLCQIADDAFARNADLRRRFPQSPAVRGQPSSSLIRFVNDRPGHDRRYAIDCGKIQRELGFVAQTSFDAGIRQTFEWFVANEPWWRKVMDGSYRQWIDAHYRQASAGP